MSSLEQFNQGLEQSRQEVDDFTSTQLQGLDQMRAAHDRLADKHDADVGQVLERLNKLSLRRTQVESSIEADRAQVAKHQMTVAMVCAEKGPSGQEIDMLQQRLATLSEQCAEKQASLAVGGAIGARMEQTRAHFELYRSHLHLHFSNPDGMYWYSMFVDIVIVAKAESVARQEREREALAGAMAGAAAQAAESRHQSAASSTLLDRVGDRGEGAGQVAQAVGRFWSQCVSSVYHETCLRVQRALLLRGQRESRERTKALLRKTMQLSAFITRDLGQLHSGHDGMYKRGMGEAEGEGEQVRGGSQEEHGMSSLLLADPLCMGDADEGESAGEWVPDSDGDSETGTGTTSEGDDVMEGESVCEREDGDSPTSTPKPLCHIPVPWLLKTSNAPPLREYQRTGLDWLAALFRHRVNGILADEMGLGKTIQVIALLAHLAAEYHIWGPHLIIVPTSVLHNWDNELKRWAPQFKVIVYHGTKKARDAMRAGWTRPGHHSIVITSYNTAVQDAAVLKRRRFVYLVLDEAHHVRNYLSKTWRTLLELQSARRLLLTGTPLQNKVTELWALLHFLMPDFFASRTEFVDLFGRGLTRMAEGQEGVDRGVVAEVHALLRPFLLRRLKCDVSLELPSKTEHIVPVPLSRRQRYLYEEYMRADETRRQLQSGSYFKAASILMQLRKVCNHPDLFETHPVLSPLVLPTPLCPLLQMMQRGGWMRRVYDCGIPSNTPRPFRPRYPHLCPGITPSAWHPQPDLSPPPSTLFHTSISPLSILHPPGVAFDRTSTLPEGPLNARLFLHPVSVPGVSSEGCGSVGQRQSLLDRRGHAWTPSLPSLLASLSLSELSLSPASVSWLVAEHTASQQIHAGRVREGGRGVPIALRGAGSSVGAFLQRVASRSGARSVVGPVSCLNEPTKDGYSFGATNMGDHSHSPTDQGLWNYARYIAEGGTAFLNTALDQTPCPPWDTMEEGSNGDVSSAHLSTVASALGLVAGRVHKTLSLSASRCHNALTYLGVSSPVCAELYRCVADTLLQMGKGTLLCREYASAFCACPSVQGWPSPASLSMPDLPDLVLSPTSRLDKVCCHSKGVERRILYAARDVVVPDPLIMGDTAHATLFMPCHTPRQGYDPSTVQAQREWAGIELWSDPLVSQYGKGIACIGRPYAGGTHTPCQPHLSLGDGAPHPDPALSAHPQTPTSTPTPHSILSRVGSAGARILRFPPSHLVEQDCGKLTVLRRLLQERHAGGHRCLIFCQMTKMLDILEAWVNLYGYTYVRLDGSTPPQTRQDLIDRYNRTDRLFLFLLTTRAGGLGVNLTGADTVIFYDSDWNPACDAQAQDRAHRIGQTRDVHIFRLVSAYTVEENILRRAGQKQLLEKLVCRDGAFVPEFFRGEDTFHDALSHRQGQVGRGDHAVAVVSVTDVALGDSQAGDIGISDGLTQALAQAEDSDDQEAADRALREANLELQQWASLSMADETATDTQAEREGEGERRGAALARVETELQALEDVYAAALPVRRHALSKVRQEVYANAAWVQGVREEVLGTDAAERPECTVSDVVRAHVTDNPGSATGGVCDGTDAVQFDPRLFLPPLDTGGVERWHSEKPPGTHLSPEPLSV
ncbi:hypothetical protein KIPB_003621 [Kipferlia bialata]|uniref:Helicase n=1 Tax=Kipferlia bialata TaxID=797122 RepID=A0A9K3CVQ6_9EUKA|nr:hypothetical protein KIPB_003621 [Kipferlia bialata]|eukprot:g3621.t1